MPRNSERSFCCGAGGARMWMEETIGSRINENRTAEAVGTGADQIAVGCPFCRVMLSDGLTAAAGQGRGPRGGRGPRRRADAARLGEGRVRDEARRPACGAAAPGRQEVARRPRPSPSRATPPRPTTRSPTPRTSARPPRPAAAPRSSTSAATSRRRSREAKQEPASQGRAVRRLPLRHRRRRAGGQEPNRRSADEPSSPRPPAVPCSTSRPTSPKPEDPNPAANRSQRRSAAAPSQDPRRLALRHRRRRARGQAANRKPTPVEPVETKPQEPTAAARRRDPRRRLPLRHRRPRTGSRSSEPEPTPVEPVETQDEPGEAASRRRASARAPRSARQRPPRAERRRAGARRRTGTRRSEPGDHRRDREPRDAEADEEPEPKPRTRSRRRSRSRPAAARHTSRRPTSTSTSRARSSTSDGRPAIRHRRTVDGGTGAGMDFQEYVAARRTSLVRGRRAARCRGDRRAPRSSATSCSEEAARIERRADPDPVVLAALVERRRVRGGPTARRRRARPGRTPRRLAAMDPDRASGRGPRLPRRPDARTRRGRGARPRGGRGRRRGGAARADLGVPDRTSPPAS